MPYTKETLQSVYSLSPAEIDNTLKACGLSLDQQEYSDFDIESKFDLIRQYFHSQQVTDYEQAARLLQSQTANLVESSASSNPQDVEQPQANKVKQFDVSDNVGAITLASETELASLVDKITDKLVEKIPPGFVKQMYVQKAVAKLAESPEEIHEFFVQLEDKIMGQLEGKSPMQMMLERGRTKLLPHSSTKSIQLPKESENDTNIS